MHECMTHLCSCFAWEGYKITFIFEILFAFPGMYGKSWGGFNGLQVAATRPPALKTIISTYSTDDRYVDDIHYRSGCVLAREMPSWAHIMFLWNARPPHPESLGSRYGCFFFTSFCLACSELRSSGRIWRRSGIVWQLNYNGSYSSQATSSLQLRKI